MILRVAAFTGLFLAAAWPAAAQDTASRYPELDAEDYADAEKFRALEDAVNEYFDTELAERRAARLKEIEASGYSFAVVEAVVRHGRRYEKVDARIVGNVTLPEKYDPARAIPVLVGLNGLSDGYETEAASRGFATMYPWNVKGWVDPRTTDRVVEQLWEACRRVNLDVDRVYATGVSVGGHATWVAGAMRTDAWAALLPRSGSPGRILVAMSEVYLQNLHHLPVSSLVGADDEDIAKMAVKGQAVCKRFGLTTVLEVVENRGHEDFDDRAEQHLGWASELRRARYPAKLDWWGGGDMGKRHYWVEALEDTVASKDLLIDTPTGDILRDLPIRPLHVQAEIEGNVVVLHTKEVARLRVSLSPAMLDFDQEVAIRIDGKVEWKGKPERSVRTMLESSLRRMDRSRTFGWEREFPCGK